MADPDQFGAKKGPATRKASQGSVRARLAACVVEDVSRQLDPIIYNDLKKAALSKTATASKLALQAALDAGTRPEDIADFYVPALAREMGEQWCADQLGFADVTIGASRLQAMMRTLGSNWASDTAATDEQAAILLIVPENVYHTLGALVLGSQLRRKGFSVKLLLGGTPDYLASRLAEARYQAIFISASCSEKLETLRQIVDVIKISSKETCPIVIGGTILDVEHADNVTAQTGATYATKIPDEALRLCGLRETRLQTVTAGDRT